MPYQIQTLVVIQSATITFTGQQLQDLAAAREALQAHFETTGATWPQVALPARELLNALQAIAKGKEAAAPAPTGKRPQTEAQRASSLAKAEKARAAKAKTLPDPRADAKRHAMAIMDRANAIRHDMDDVNDKDGDEEEEDNEL